jgi:ATP-binding cassette, subfamily B (MDR/TAP), member 1
VLCDGHALLQNASFRIAPGQMVAFVGASGCGKSTIVRLLLRYYDVTSGEILLDGVNIRQLNVKWLREQFGLVQQEPDLFPDTLEYNIQYGEPGADLHPSDPTEVAHARSATEVPTSVVEAATAANAASFIDGFSLKYATRAGELGSQLSGGQKQRIAIARAIIRKPHMLLLDEATSALDSESERIVQQALDDLITTRFGGVTTLVIAHRLSTIRGANVIVVLDEVCVLLDHL